MPCLIVMGVSGCGKTTIGQMLVAQLMCEFADADDFHSTENKNKMASGIPLTDADRYPWLLTLHGVLQNWQQRGVFGVLCCSALKKKYRDMLLNGATSTSTSTSHHSELKSSAPKSESETKYTIKDALFVYLRGDSELIERRLRGRTNHYMPASLLQSQLQTLEEPDADEPCIVVDISKDSHEIVSEILTHIRLLY